MKLRKLITFDIDDWGIMEHVGGTWRGHEFLRHQARPHIITLHCVPLYNTS